jgi:hypothetical protein
MSPRSSCCVAAKRADGSPLALRDRADHRADVPALHLLHDHRPEDHRAIEARQVAVAFAVATMEMVLRLNHVVYAPYYALFIVGPARCCSRCGSTRGACVASPHPRHER